MAASFTLESLGFIKYFAVTVLVVNWQQVLFSWTAKFSLEATLQTNDVIESDVEEVIKKQLSNAPKRKDDEKTQMTEIIALIRPMST